MIIPDIQRRIVQILRDNNGDFGSTDNSWCEAVGEPSYDKIQAALVELKKSGRIEWMRTGDGAVNKVRLLK